MLYEVITCILAEHKAAGISEHVVVDRLLTQDDQLRALGLRDPGEDLGDGQRFDLMT